MTSTVSPPNRELRRHPERLMTLSQLIEARPWLTERYVRRLVAERRVGFYKPGLRLLFDVDEVDAYVEQTRVDPAG